MSNTLTPDMLGFIGGFGPAPAPENTNPEYSSRNTDEVVRNPADIKKEDKPAEKSVDKKDEKVEPKQSLADLLRADREARATRTREESESKTAKEELVKVRSELESLRNAPSFESDPIGYVKAKKLSQAEQIALGEALIYDLAPDKAPADLRIKLYEAKRRREDIQREEQARDLAGRQELEKIQRDLQAFTQAMEDNARNLQTGTFPESEDWFITDDGILDTKNYSASLVATAQNMAGVAQRKGLRADLSFTNVAKTLEAEIAKRMTRRDSKRSKQTASTKTEDKRQDTGTRVETTSVKGLNSGAPETPSWDDAERVRRAIRAGFNT